MSRIHASTTTVIDAPAHHVYSILADYYEGHPRILPDIYFSGLEVEQGGQGAGTIITVQMRNGTAKRKLRMEVSEPDPGRILAERDLDTGATTTFTVEPVEDGRFASVTVDTSYTRNGIAGLVERLVVPSLLRKIYTDELLKLESVASVAELGLPR